LVQKEMSELSKYTTDKLQQFYSKYTKLLESDDAEIRDKAKKYLQTIVPELKIRIHLEKVRKLSEQDNGDSKLNRSGRLPIVEKKKKKLNKRKKKKK
jgi:hypothetical protein